MNKNRIFFAIGLFIAFLILMFFIMDTFLWPTLGYIMFWAFLAYILFLQSGDMTTIISRANPNISPAFHESLSKLKFKLPFKKDPETIDPETLERKQFFCDHCGEMIPQKYWTPITGFILARGKTQCCKKPIPRVYFIAELITLTGLLAISIFFRAQPLIATGVAAAYFALAVNIICAIKYKFRYRFRRTQIFALLIILHKQLFTFILLFVLTTL